MFRKLSRILSATLMGAGLAAAGLAGTAMLGANSVWAAGGGDAPAFDPDRLADQSLLIGVARAGDRLVVVGEFGHILLSDDKGVTWRLVKNRPTTVTLTSVSFVDAEIGWAVGHDEVVLKTTDGGETWEKQFGGTDSDNALLTVIAQGPDKAIAMGAFSFALKTVDGGKTWEQFQLLPGSEDDSHLQAAFAGPGGSLFVAAEYGSIFRSMDGGAIWEKIETGYEGSFWGGLTLKSGSILVAGMRGNVWRSDDQGTTWIKVETGAHDSLSGIAELNDGTILVVGLGGAIATSTDGGQSFTSTNRADRKAIASVAEGPAGEVILIGETGIKRAPAIAKPEG